MSLPLPLPVPLPLPLSMCLPLSMSLSLPLPIPLVILPKKLSVFEAMQQLYRAENWINRMATPQGLQQEAQILINLDQGTAEYMLSVL